MREARRAEAEREFGRRTAEADPSRGAEGGGEVAGDREAPLTDPAVESGDPAGGASTSRPAAGESAAAGDPPPEERVSSPAVATPDVSPDEIPETALTPGQEPGAEAILAEADAAYSGLSSLRATFVQRVDLPLVDRSAQGHGVWLQQGRDRFLMDFTEPAEDVFVADGEFLWLYQPSATPGQVIKSALEGGGQAAGGADVLGRILSEARASYDAVHEGSAIVSGVRTHVIALTPRGPSEYRRVRIWIADGDRLVRRFRIEEENETIRTVTLADLEPDVPVDPSVFSFAVPDGVQVFER